MRNQSEYPIDELLDFLDPSFPKRVNRRKGFGRSPLIPTDAKGATEIRETLCLFVDAWIASGFQPDGSERRLLRNFAPKVCSEYPESVGELSLSPAPEAIKAMAELIGGTLQVEASKGGEILYRVSALRGYSVTICPKGGLAYSPTMTMQDEPRLIAASLFLEFYRSSWLFLLMKCQRCSKFAVPKQKPEDDYKRGWHCPNCSSKATAANRVREVRRESSKQWMGLVVEFLHVYDSTVPKPREERINWVTKKVNKKLSALNADYIIDRKRIVRKDNWGKIEAWRRNHAES